VRSGAWLTLAPAAWAGYAWGSQLLARAGAGVWRGRPDRRQVCLSFDDGPDPTWTPRVLDILRRESVSAAFFLVGRRAAAAPDLARRIAEEGHDLGNHTWSHRSLWLLGPAATRDQVRMGHGAIAAACGRAPGFFRAPWGMTNLALFPVLRELGTRCVFWSVQLEGLRPASPAAQVARAVRGARPGVILDLHDADGVPGAGARLCRALPEIIDRLRGRRYALVPLRDLL
jgi:peptidoglycan/xylan/chitin deacetylase (PgdA/CDA1 family)